MASGLDPNPISLSVDPVKIDPAQADTLLAAAKTRNPDLNLSTAAKTFTDPTVYFKDDTRGALYTMSLRKGGFFEWSFASSGDGIIPPVDELAKIFQFLLNEATTQFGKFPYSGTFNEKCPWIRELTNGGKDLTIVDRVASAINLILPNTVVVLDPPQEIIIDDGTTEINFGIVYAHTVPLLLEKR